MLYTVVPLDAVFPSEAPQTELVELDGAYLEGTKCEDGIQITRLISTDPRMYLDKRYSPGARYRRPETTG